MINLTNITVWALGLVASVAMASSVAMNNHIGKLDDQQNAVVQRVSVVETESVQYKQDIQDINKKLDALLYANGVNPAKIK